MSRRFDPFTELVLAAYHFAQTPKGNGERLHEAATGWLEANPLELSGETFALADQAKDVALVPPIQREEAARLVGLVLDRLLAARKRKREPDIEELPADRWDVRNGLVGGG